VAKVMIERDMSLKGCPGSNVNQEVSTHLTRTSRLGAIEVRMVHAMLPQGGRGDFA
jgi:hypothetical protein